MVLGMGEMDASPAGRTIHQRPLPCPEGMVACRGIGEVFYRQEPAWGGQKLLASETLAIELFAAGFSLTGVVIELSGVSGARRTPFTVRQEVASLPRGQMVRIEVASYELPDDPRELNVSVLSADLTVDA